MNQSESLSNLAQALAKVQGKLRPAEENASNPFFKSKYADLGSVIASARELMAQNGLSVSQFPGPTTNGDALHYATLTTILMHESGEWLSQDLTMPLAKVDPQGYGSAITYARRYALAAVLGIVTGEDDDGNAATGKPEPPAVKNDKPKTPAQFKSLCVSNLGYTGPEHVEGALKLIYGKQAVPGTIEAQRAAYVTLKQYKELRDSGKSQDEALQAMADKEVE